MKISTRIRNGLLVSLGTFFNSGSMLFRSGVAPANIGDVMTGTLLGTTTFGVAALAAPVAGSVATSAIGADVSADADGTVGHVVVLGSDSAQDAFLSVGVTGSGADVELDTLTFQLGGVVAVTGGSFTMPIGTI